MFSITDWLVVGSLSQACASTDHDYRVLWSGNGRALLRIRTSRLALCPSRWRGDAIALLDLTFATVNNSLAASSIF